MILVIICRQILVLLVLLQAGAAAHAHEHESDGSGSQFNAHLHLDDLLDFSHSHDTDDDDHDCEGDHDSDAVYITDSTYVAPQVSADGVGFDFPPSTFELRRHDLADCTFSVGTPPTTAGPLRPLYMSYCSYRN